MTKRLATPLALIAACAAAAALAGCGSEDPKTSHVDGSWTLAAAGAAPKATWKIESTCESGPCDFKVDFGLGQPPVTYKYDASTGAYLNKISATQDCLRADGSTAAKEAVTVTSDNTFSPTAAKKIDGTSSATAADIESKQTVSVNAAAKKAKCANGDSLPPTTQKATRTDLGG